MFANKEIHVLTDHKGSQNINNYYSPSTKINSLLSALTDFNLVFHYVRGAYNQTADSLSRAPIENLPGELSASETVGCYKLCFSPQNPEESLLNKIKRAQEEDEQCQEIIRYLTTGQPPSDKRKAAKMEATQKHFVIKKGYLCYRPQRTNEKHIVVVVPDSMQNAVMKWAHDGQGHFGIKESLRKLKDSCYWKSQRADLEDYIKQCTACARV